MFHILVSTLLSPCLISSRNNILQLQAYICCIGSTGVDRSARCHRLYRHNAEYQNKPAQKTLSFLHLNKVSPYFFSLKNIGREIWHFCNSEGTYTCFEKYVHFIQFPLSPVYSPAVVVSPLTGDGYLGRFSGRDGHNVDSMLMSC